MFIIFLHTNNVLPKDLRELLTKSQHLPFVETQSNTSLVSIYRYYISVNKLKIFFAKGIFAVKMANNKVSPMMHTGWHEAEICEKANVYKQHNLVHWYLQIPQLDFVCWPFNFVYYETLMDVNIQVDMRNSHFPGFRFTCKINLQELRVRHEPPRIFYILVEGINWKSLHSTKIPLEVRKITDIIL